MVAPSPPISPPPDLAPAPQGARTSDTPCLRPLPEHFSFSSLSLFQQCPRKWAYSYLMDAEKEFVPAALAFGSALHRGVEALHWAVLSGNPARFEDAWAAYEASWAEEGAVTAVRFTADEDRAFYDRMARVLLENYCEQHLPRLGRILAIEESVRVELPAIGLPLVGRLDLLVEEAQELVLVDFKTSQKGFDEAKLRQGALQLAVYAQALGELAESLEKPLRGRFVVLRKLLKPRIEVVDVPLDDAQVERLAPLAGETWRLIRAAHSARAFPPLPGWSCKGCPFQARCQLETGAPNLGQVEAS